MEKTELPDHLLETDPTIDPSVFIARGAQIMGDVRVASGSSVWYNVVLRGDINYIDIGANTNIQDGSIVHVENDRPCIVRENVTVGHGAILHACTIEPECLIGMGAIILSGAVIGKGSIIAAGTLIRENIEVKPFSLMVGVPGRLLRTLDSSNAETNRKWALKYAAVAQAHQERGFSAHDSVNNTL
ncbi:MAG: gamma carbonic anhydrase family protein [Spirochaetaceae bacterium]|nr:MAG: gamma carbonic anhydrase family protein [Spirochaetaceae bacterium]